MTKITKITPEQEAKIPEYIEKWVRLASQPLNREKTVKVTKELFGEDKTVIVAESIQNAIDIIRFIVGGKKVEYSSQLYNQLDNQLYNQLGSQLYNQLDNQLYNQLDNQLGSQLGSQLYNQLYNQLGSQLGSQLDNKINWARYTTQYWLSWIGYYDYAKFIGVKFDTKKMQRMEEILMAIPSIITLGDILLVIENPVCRWEDSRLHSDQRPAIEWKDETGIYLLDGVKFEKELWEKVVSKKMTFGEIMAIDISDQRTVALKYNPEAIIKENAKLVHKDNRNNELYLIEGNKLNEELEFPKIWFLRMTCPTGRVFVEGVPPEEAEKNPDAGAMQALLCGLSVSEYASMKLES